MSYTSNPALTVSPSPRSDGGTTRKSRDSPRSDRSSSGASSLSTSPSYPLPLPPALATEYRPSATGFSPVESRITWEMLTQGKSTTQTNAFPQLEEHISRYNLERESRTNTPRRLLSGEHTGEMPKLGPMTTLFVPVGKHKTVFLTH